MEIMDIMMNIHSTGRKEIGTEIETETGTGESTEKTGDGTAEILIEEREITGTEGVGKEMTVITGNIVIKTIGTETDTKINTGNNRHSKRIKIPSSHHHSPLEYHITEKTVLSKKNNLGS